MYTPEWLCPIDSSVYCVDQEYRSMIQRCVYVRYLHCWNLFTDIFWPTLMWSDSGFISLSNMNCLARFLPRVYLLMQSCRNLPHPYLAAKPYCEESCITWIADGDTLTVPSRCSPSSWCRSPGLPSSASIGLACRLCYKTREPLTR